VQRRLLREPKRRRRQHLLRRRVRRQRAATSIQANVRGYLERERCPLLSGGKQAFEYPRRLEDTVLPFKVGATDLGSKARADLAFVMTALKTDKSLKLRVLGCTVHTEAGTVGLQRAKAVVSHLTKNGVLRQQCRAEHSPPVMLNGLTEHGMAAVRFTVVQSMLFSKRLSFATGSAALPATLETVLEKVARTLQAHPDLDLVLEGHADAHEGQPLELSKARAMVIKKWLMDHGAKCKLRVLPCGAAYPVASNLTAQGRRHNRRVEVQIRLSGGT